MIKARVLGVFILIFFRLSPLPAQIISHHLYHFKISEVQSVSLKSGDILLSKSNYLMSSIVTQITRPISKYSHTNVLIVGSGGVPFLVDVSPKSGLSMKRFQIERFLHNKVRFRVLRLKNQAAASEFALKIVSTLQQCRHCNNPSYFDFNFNRFADNVEKRRFTCTEFIADALKQANIIDMGADQNNFSKLTRYKGVIQSHAKLGKDLPDLVLAPDAFLNQEVFKTIFLWTNFYEEKNNLAKDAAVLLELFNPNHIKLDKALFIDILIGMVKNFFVQEEVLQSMNFAHLSFHQKMISVQLLIRVRKRYEEIKNLSVDQIHSLTALAKS